MYRLIKSAAALLVAIAGMCLQPAAISQGAGYWHTSGNQILDAHSKSVRIAGINWYGFETTDQVVHGLYNQDYHTIIATMKALGYNTIRLPYSNEMVEKPLIPSAIGYYGGAGPINADLTGLNSIEILDKIVDAAGAAGMKVILDNHRSEAGASNEASGLWYTSTYSETKWIADWKMLASRYKGFVDTAGNPIVIGMDIRNEPHLLAGVARSGSCWTGDTMTAGCPATDKAHNWPAAAERAAAAILTINPWLLIFVEGIDCYSGDCGWQGGNLEGASKYPVRLPVANRLVYSAHDYGPDLYKQAWFTKSTTSTNLEAMWNKYWGYLTESNAAPIWIGEFGTGNDTGDIESALPGSQGQWFSSLTSFLANHPRIHWSYWAVNGEDSYGLLDDNYDAVPLNSLKQQALEAMQFPLNGIADGSTSCAARPAIPIGLAAISLSSSEMQLSWLPVQIPLNCRVTYKVFRGTTYQFTPSAANQVGSGLATPTFTDSGLNASTKYFYAIEALDSRGSSGASAQIDGTTLGTQSGLACHVSYSLAKSWTGGFQAAIQIQSIGATNLTSWKLKWTWPGSQTVSSFWGGVENQSGAVVTVTNASYNGKLPAGGILQGIGMTVNYSGTNTTPPIFKLNGVTCK